MKRELDARAATVLGCVLGWTGRSDGLGSPLCTCEDRAHEQPDTYVPRMLARYSEDIAAAWQVVEWMNRERKWVVRVESDWDGSASVGVFTDSGTPSHWRMIADIDVDAGSDAVPEAVCLAFLAAMGK